MTLRTWVCLTVFVGISTIVLGQLLSRSFADAMCGSVKSTAPLASAAPRSEEVLPILREELNYAQDVIQTQQSRVDDIAIYALLPIFAVVGWVLSRADEEKNKASSASVRTGAGSPTRRARSDFGNEEVIGEIGQDLVGQGQGLADGEFLRTAGEPAELWEQAERKRIARQGDRFHVQPQTTEPGRHAKSYDGRGSLAE